MVKTGQRFLIILFTVCVLLTGCIASLQQSSLQDVRSTTAAPIDSKQDLARAALLEAGIAKRYDLSLDNALYTSLLPGATGETQALMRWLHDLFVKKAGWQLVEADYVAHLETDFSETELKELLSLAQQPLMKKLLQSEIASYESSAQQRHKLIFETWD
jgi:hypothetical protein